MKENKVIQMHQNPLLTAAIAYAAIGWKVLPAWWIENGACACGNTSCKSPGKHPIGRVAPFGQNSATIDTEKIKGWWQQYPNANIAAYLEPSGLCAIDIDPRNGGIQTIDDIEAKHGSLVSDLLQFTGGGGEHRVFQKPSNLSMPGKLGAGVDVKLNGYIMLEPSNHISGKLYSWEASSDPRDGVLPSPLPDWLRDLAGHARVVSPSGAPVIESKTSLIVPQTVREELDEALAVIPADDRERWLHVGMALHATDDMQWAFTTWDAWSKKSKAYDPVDQVRVWHSFRSNKGVGENKTITYRAIFQWSKEQGVVVFPKAALPIPTQEPVRVLEAPKAEAVPDNLLNPPGVLGVVTNWVNATSRKNQPMFSVQAAIGFASTVLGRRFVTSNRNWSSLYLLNIGKSASGKEHAKWALETLLEACDMHSLIGPSSYTSNSGVLSALHDQPSHITIIDEFGKELEQASVKQNARAQSMLKSLIEVWGRCDGVVRPQGYSTFGMTSADAAKIKERSVRNPALSLLGMTTPDTFFDTIGSAAARDGFLNRFLIVESDIGRQTSAIVDHVDVPQEIIEWAKTMQLASNGSLNQVSNPSIAADPVVVPLSRYAKQMFQDFDAECVALMDQYEVHGLAEMFGRTNEIAMRLALICAVGRAKTVSVEVEGEDAAWAIQYARFHAQRTADRLVTSLFDSEFEAAKQQVMKLIVSKGPKGMTVRELGKSSRRFNGMNKRQQIELLDSIAFLGKITYAVIPTQSGRSERNAWVAIDDHEDDQETDAADKKGVFPPAPVEGGQ